MSATVFKNSIYVKTDFNLRKNYIRKVLNYF